MPVPNRREAEGQRRVVRRDITEAPVPRSPVNPAAKGRNCDKDGQSQGAVVKYPVYDVQALGVAAAPCLRFCDGGVLLRQGTMAALSSSAASCRAAHCRRVCHGVRMGAASGKGKKMALKIILVEDDRSIRTMLEYYFTSMGHQVLAYESGEELFAGQVQGDIALLDGMLPGMDGVDIVRRLRRDPVTAKMPIIMLTARQTEMDKVTALDSGADDYITKPFGVMELQARINAVIRRVGDREPQLVYGDLVIDPAGRTVRRGEEEISLTYKEFELLRLLVSRRGTVLTRDEILAAVWDYNFVGETRTVDMHIKSLRQKLGEGYITTVRSVGYKMV